ncbi:polycystic kidney disease protein 1-like 2 [Orbicella faveolata]|uniref:polycystic kidney disease protein 1-like 2 n=1 Tax=Orbicella faveolata TaxID=48498 RepID=UPI0009E1BEEA|nr:polycystic kidney disease protein 1-like 2 [Orbicella faveolata]XP_020622593.1 polycystic kidney disease protein 1-like 2 [Orbicella faveolata]
MPRNYYNYDETSKGVNSPVVSLSYEDKEKEEAIPVSNLETYIEYSLPGPDVLPESHKYSLNVTENTWAYHKLVISSKDEAVNIEVTPFKCSHKLHLYVRENRHPTKDKFTWKKIISEPSSGDRPSLNYTTCFEKHSAYTLFISNTKLRESTYFIGIWYANGKQDTRNSNETDVMRYSIRVLKSKCLYWNERKESWMGDGCIVGPLTSPKRIHCMTNHLTSFGSGMFVAPNPIDFSKALLGFATAFQSGNVVVMFTILTLLILYTLLAVWTWRTDKRDAMQVRK